VLTNRRLIYEMERPRGLLSSEGRRILLDIPLGQIRNVSEAHPLLPLPVLASRIIRIETLGEYFDFAVRDPGELLALITGVVHTALMADAETEKRRKMMVYERELALNKAGVQSPPIYGEPQLGGIAVPQVFGIRHCDSCGLDSPSTARYCAQCGSPLD